MCWNWPVSGTPGCQTNNSANNAFNQRVIQEVLLALPRTLAYAHCTWDKHTLRIRNTCSFSTATTVTRTRLSVTNKPTSPLWSSVRSELLRYALAHLCGGNREPFPGCRVAPSRLDDTVPFTCKVKPRVAAPVLPVSVLEHGAWSNTVGW
jgi:hypothetical protein